MTKPSNKLKIKYKRVLDAYFAERKDEPQFEEDKKATEPKTHTVASGENLTVIAKKHNTTVAKIMADNNIKVASSIKPKQILKVGTKPKKKKIGDKVTFTRLSGASLGNEVYVIVKTQLLEDKKIFLNVKQGIEEKAEVEKNNKGLMLQQGDKISTKGEAVVGAFAKNDKITNKDDFKKWAIFKFILGDKDTKKEAGVINKLTDKKASMYLLIDAHSSGNIKVFYNGYNPDDNGKADLRSSPNHWLDMNNKWFQLGACECCNMSVGTDGFVSNPKITKKQVKALEKSGLTSFTSVVLHRTVSSNYKSPLKSFESGVGTHFLIAKDGTIYQTASLNFRTSHVGKIRSRCYEEDNTLCTAAELKIIKSWEDKGASKAAKPVHNIEKNKSYPTRYPTNIDSIGIEVVGNYISDAWEALPEKQINAVVCLVNFLMSNFNLDSKSDLYTHEQVSRKHEGEGGFTLNLIKNLIN